jgi:uncharacterized repeat protein (TIGR01451 family)
MCVAACAVVMLLGPAGASAATLTVMNGADSGVGSLRAAVASASDGDLIMFAPTATTVTLTGVPIAITHKITIQGNAGLAGPATTINRNNAGRLFAVDAPGGPVTFENLTLTGGKLTIPSTALSGGGGAAIQDTGGGGLTLSNLGVTGNTMTVTSQNDSGGAGVYEGGGGPIVATNVNFTNNTLTVLQPTGGVDGDGGGGLWTNGALTYNAGQLQHNVDNAGSNMGGGAPSGAADGGGALYLQGPASSTLTNVDIELNSVDGTQGADSVGGGGIWTAGPLTIQGGLVRANSASIQGAANESGGGGILSNGRPVTLEASHGMLSGPAAIEQNTVFGTTSGNENGGGGINDSGGDVSASNTFLLGNEVTISAVSDNGGGAIYDGGGSVSLTASTLTQNTVSLTGTTTGNGGGAVYDGGGALMTTLNTTIGDNTVSVTIPGGTGSDGGGGIYAQGTLKTAATTIVDNHEDQAGGGIYQATGTATLKSTLLAGNSAAAGNANCSAATGTFGSAGYNLEDTTPTQCGLSSATHDVVGVNPHIGPLIFDFPAYVHRLLNPSAAIDAIPPAACTDQSGNPITTDERATTRPQGGKCDIGAYEAVPADLSLTASAAPASVTIGSGSALSFAVANTGPATATNVTVTVTLPAGLAFTNTGSSPACTDPGAGATVICTLGTLATTAHASATVAVTAGATGAQTVTATVASDQPDPTPANDTASTTVAVTGGQTGPTGPTGLTGVTGVTGSTSPSGVTSPAGPTGTPGAPTNTTPPSISGTPLPGDLLTCHAGAWSGGPTAYTYRWFHDGQPIPGATGSTYTVAVGDATATLTCAVTAIGPGGKSAPVMSAGVIVGMPSAFHCPKPTGSLGGRHVGPLAIGMTRSLARHTLKRTGTAGAGFDNFCLYAGFGIRVAYPSTKLLREVRGALAKRVAGRIVIALTANPFYTLRGIAAGATVTAAIRAWHLGKPFVIGLNDWYVGPAGAEDIVLKVRHGVVQEIGLADRRLTGTRVADKRLLSSFRKLS